MLVWNIAQGLQTAGDIYKKKHNVVVMVARNWNLDFFKRHTAIYIYML